MDDTTPTSAADLPSGALEIVDRLALEPHPEGGWYRQTFRDDRSDGSIASTAIYFLLARGERSHWHRVRNAAEVWHHYSGGPLRLRISADGQRVEHRELGGDLAAGQHPQIVVPADHWQSAQPLADWTLVGCTVAPGYEFANFELADPGWEPSG